MVEEGCEGAYAIICHAEAKASVCCSFSLEEITHLPPTSTISPKHRYRGSWARLRKMK